MNPPQRVYQPSTGPTLWQRPVAPAALVAMPNAPAARPALPTSRLRVEDAVSSDLLERERDKALRGVLAGVYASSDWSDLKILSGGEELEVHRNIVCSQSPVLANSCGGRFQEAETHVVNASHHDVVAVKCMLRFMYTADYSVSRSTRHSHVEPASVNNPTSPVRSDDVETLVHTRVYALGEYYQVPSLKSSAKRKFQTSLPRDDTKTFRYLSPANYLVIAQEVYSTTPAHDRGLRDIILGYMVNASVGLLEQIDFAAVNTGDFLNDFIPALARDRITQVGELYDQLRTKKGQIEGLELEKKKLQKDLDENRAVLKFNRTESLKQKSEYLSLKEDHDKLLASHNKLKTDHRKLESDYSSPERQNDQDSSENASNEVEDDSDEEIKFVRTRSQKRQRTE